MPDTWLFFAFLLVAVLSGAATGVLSLLIGGVGGQWALTRRVKLTEERLEDVNDRITKEVKRRAGEAGVEARAKSPKKLAEEHLAAAAIQRPAATRPSVVSLPVAKRELP